MKANSDFIEVFEHVLSPEYCQNTIEQLRSHESLEEDPQPDYSMRRYMNLSQNKNLNTLTMKFSQVANDLAQEYFQLPEGMEESQMDDWWDDGFIFAHYRPGDDLKLHVDGHSSEEGRNGLRLVTVLFFLNDIANGGELIFPMQERNVQPQQGSAVVFPVSFTHPHRVAACKSDRFIVQTWLTDTRFVVNDA